MTLFRTVLLTSGLVLGICCTATAQELAAKGKTVTLEMPATPDPVPVTLDPKTTGIVVMDFIEHICNREPKCKNGMLPAVTPFLTRARKAGVMVAYGTRSKNVTEWLPQIAPMPGDVRVVNTTQDRFYETDLDKAFKAKGVKTVILVGWKASGAVTYTSVGAMGHGYTVVVPLDTTAAHSDYEQTIGLYNVLNSGTENRANHPLQPNSATLSRTDLISFQ